MSSLEPDSKPLSRTNLSHSSFIPNFILVSSDQVQSTLVKIEDILGFQKTLEIAYNIFYDSQDRLGFILQQSNILLVCTISLVKEILTNVVYQSYQAITITLETALDWSVYNPLFGRRLAREVAQVESVSNNGNFWWLSANSRIHDLLQSLINLLIGAIKLFQKAYLVILVVGSLGVLQLVSGLTQSPAPPQSFMAKFVQNNTLPVTTNAQSPIEQVGLVELEVEPVNKATSSPDVQRILSYEAKEDDNLDLLATNFGVLPDTISFNNNITKLEPGQKVFIPWTDGYIYNASEEMNIDELARIYKTDRDNILKFNQAVFDNSKNSFQKDSLILIPTSDFQAIAQSNKDEQQRKDDLIKQKQQAEEDAKRQAEEKIKAEKEAQAQRQRAIAQAAVEVSVSSEASSIASLVWPTNGRISRCNLSGHLGCDITNSIGTSIVAASSGTVVEAGWKNGGFGNMVLIDHGNGIRAIYMHMSQVTVTAGQIVNSGEQIGLMGSTGNSTGSHLHFGVFVNGREVNPLQYLP